jgi:hypothetical protein
MKSFSEFQEKSKIEEALSPEIKEVIGLLSQAVEIADQYSMAEVLEILENATQQIIEANK